MEETHYIKYDCDSNVLANRYSGKSFSKNEKIQVNNKQEVVVLVNKKIKQILPPGIHDLKLYNIDIKNVIGGFFGKNKGEEKVDVWFVNKIKRVSIFWKLNSYTLYDCNSNSHVPIYAEGRSILSLVDSRQFILSLFVNSLANLVSIGDFTRLTANNVTTLIVKTINDYLLENKIPTAKISENLNSISALLKKNVSSMWLEYGFQMTEFEIGKIRILENSEMSSMSDINQNDALGEGFRSYKAEAKSVAQDDIVNAMKDSTGIVETMQAVSRYGILCSDKADLTNAAGASAVHRTEGVSIEVYCHECGTRYKSDKGFCPRCGKKYNPCPICGADNDESARVCLKCGHDLVQTTKLTCPSCHKEVNIEDTFCSNCGKRLK